MSPRPMIAIALVLIAATARPASAAPQEDQLRRIERRLDSLEKQVADDDGWPRWMSITAGTSGVVLVGLFCGLWARSTGRDFWLWTVGGMLFTFFALLVLYGAIEDDKKAARRAAEKAAKEPLDVWPDS